MNPLAPSFSHTCATTKLNRLGELRADAGWIAGRLDDPASRYVVVWEGKLLFADDDSLAPVFIAKKALTYFDLDDGAFVLLGEADSVTYFAVDLSDATSGVAEILSPYGHFHELRKAAPLLGDLAGELLVFAKAISHWHMNHRFCGVCGSPTVSRDGGHRRLCSGCDVELFPRTDPAIIVIVASGDRCLLGRQASWPAGMFSALAGFVDPGESLEAAVEREVWEEAGVRLQTVTYRGSQPWPFPCSIMLGFRAEPATTELNVNKSELEDARWFTRGEIRNAVAEGTMKVPRSYSISYRLLEDWFDEGACGSLSDLAGK